MTTSTTGVRGIIAQGNYLFSVIGNVVYRYNSTTPEITDPVILRIGEIGTTSGNVSMASNGVQICIVDGDQGYIATNTASLAKITDPGFPNGADTVVSTDLVFVACKDGVNQFNQSNISDGFTWNALATATKVGAPDPLRTIAVSQRELIIIGYQTSEIWVNNGGDTVLFQRSGNAFIQAGCVSRSAVSNLDNTIFWLGSDNNGVGIVYRLQGYTPIRISTHAEEFTIAKSSNLSDAVAFSYQQEGHTYYVLTIPDLDKTLVYDLSTNQWHDRAYRDPLTGDMGRWRANCHAVFAGKNIVGDFENGNVCYLDLDVYLDNATFDENGDPEGDMIKRVLESLILNEDQRLLFFPRVQIDMEVAVGTLRIGTNQDQNQAKNPQIMLRYSDDSGYTWSDILVEEIGMVGEYDRMIIFSALGSGYNRSFEMSITDPVKAVVLGANGWITAGDH